MMAVRLTPVKSKAASHEGYDPATKTLRIRYASGGLYEATDVEPHQYEALKAAESFGRHLNTHFRAKLERVDE